MTQLTADLLLTCAMWQVSPDRQFVFIADSSIIAQAPAIIVFKVETGQSWRVLEGDSSVHSLAQSIFRNEYRDSDICGTDYLWH